ncbi:MAG TPA: hypothetical protein VKF36_21460 [Syntrophorhabdales bacterium]|nr:hypothetical protein [Syntrophorhabdales bacterium]
MFKTVSVSFRTRHELLEGLDRICEEFKCSRSSLIETILREFLSGKDGSAVRNGNLGVVTAAEQQPQEVESGDGVVYLLLGGVRIGLPKNLRFQILFDEKVSAFQLDLVPGQVTSANFRLSRPESSVRPAHPAGTGIRMTGKGGMEKHVTEKDAADES